MIHYNLKCENNHAFSSWFDSLEAFDKLEKTNMLSCPSCGSDDIKRAIMSPQVSPSRTKQAVSLTKPASEIEKKISDARKKLKLSQKMWVRILHLKREQCTKEIPLFVQFMEKQRSKMLNL